MSYADIEEITEVSNLGAANRLIEAGQVLLQIVPGRTSDGYPCTLFYLGRPKAAVRPSNPLLDQLRASGAFDAPNKA